MEDMGDWGDGNDGVEMMMMRDKHVRRVYLALWLKGRLYGTWGLERRRDSGLVRHGGGVMGLLRLYLVVRGVRKGGERRMGKGDGNVKGCIKLCGGAG